MTNKRVHLSKSERHSGCFVQQKRCGLRLNEKRKHALIKCFSLITSLMRTVLQEYLYEPDGTSGLFPDRNKASVPEWCRTRERKMLRLLSKKITFLHWNVFTSGNLIADETQPGWWSQHFPLHSHCHERWAIIYSNQYTVVPRYAAVHFS